MNKINEKKDLQIRERLVIHIQGGEAFMPVDRLLDKIPFEKTEVVPEGLPYSFYQQFYHLRLAQYDILEFTRNPNYESPKWPEGYWPEQTGPDKVQEWELLTEAYFTERTEFCDYISDTDINLFEPIPHGTGQTPFREALLLTEHNAYHTGQLLMLLRLLNLH